MKTINLLAFACLLLAIACDAPSKKEKEDVKLYEPATTVADPVERGKLLVNSIGCHDCHTPKKMTDHGPTIDPDRLLSGHPASEVLLPYDKETAKNYALFSMGLTAAIGPWGTSFAANLTSDDTGIGTWTEEQFLVAIKEGKFKGQKDGRSLLPPMPWEFYKNFPDEDLKAIFAYLKTVKPVENVVPAPLPPAM
ncbi:hypothetical protein ATE92_0961 [Ulvibacter sp. MAR_2010_11]|uniref:c-type cytochrome n=1 Tax=Ulvibacter sp. MAR_2010_11 TaxID=1250229 RepID=UPI000C2BF8CE|nr:c-type cytochrome [Ulvibacter sp. MAR_2010_11]PKA82822.1 hypothetical protein ATE92_0961 [Ulvibacter sp. MAR_2010_11]